MKKKIYYQRNLNELDGKNLISAPKKIISWRKKYFALS